MKSRGPQGPSERAPLLAPPGQHPPEFPRGLSDSASSRESPASDRSKECKSRAKRLLAAVTTEGPFQSSKDGVLDAPQRGSGWCE